MIACHLIDTWPSAVVIIEDFILQKLNKGRDLLSPVRIGSKIEYQLYKQGRTVQWQLPAAAKTTVSDARLKELQLYDSRGGFEHARDADRHVVLFIRRCLGIHSLLKELRHKAWPHILMKGRVVLASDSLNCSLYDRAPRQL